MDDTKRTLQGMTIKVGDIKFTIPITSIRQSIKVERESSLIDPSGNEMLSIHGEVYNLVRLYEFYSIDTDVTDVENGIVMLLENGDNLLCILADELIGETDITIFPMPEYLPNMSGLSGCSIIDDGEIYLIVDVAAFFDEAGSTDTSALQYAGNGGQPTDAETMLLDLANNDELKNKYFTFEIDGEEYGIEVANIKEIIGVKEGTKVPGAPYDIDGIISLRGEVIPVINVRKRFHKADRLHDAKTSIIVVNYQKYTVGLIVDSVKEVVYIGPDEISNPPSAKINYYNQFICKLGTSGDKVKQLIDLERFLFHS